MKTLSVLAILLCGSLLTGCSRYKDLTVKGPVSKEKKPFQMPSQKDAGKRKNNEAKPYSQDKGKDSEPTKASGSEDNEQTGVWSYLQSGAAYLQSGFNYVWDGTAWVLDKAGQGVKSAYNRVTGANEGPNTN